MAEKYESTGMAQVYDPNAFYDSPFSPSYTEVRSNPRSTTSSVSFTNAEGTRLGGLIVNMKWEKALRLCEAKIREFERAGAPVKSGTWVDTLIKLADYLTSIKRGDSIPMRRATVGDEKSIRAKGKFRKGSLTSSECVVSLWEDIDERIISSEGNVKLPFAAYSELPLVTCPGAGGVSMAGVGGDKDGLGAAVATVRQKEDTSEGCAAWCYSFNGLRYATVFYRLVLLTLGATVHPEYHVSVAINKMLRLWRSSISKRSKKSGKDELRILRLFVDGDFRSERHIVAWMEGCKRLYHESGGRIIVYGYSKSWQELVSLHRKGYQWPTNYVMNISSGSRHQHTLLGSVRKLPIARSRFVAVPILQRLCMRAFGNKAGRKIHANFEQATKHLDKKSKAYQVHLQQLSLQVGQVAPDLLEAWMTANARIEALLRGGNKSAALNRLNKAAGKTGKEAMPAGFAAQQASAALLRTLDAPTKKTNFTCPIDCGSCPTGPLGTRPEELLADTVDIDEVAEALGQRDSSSKIRKPKKKPSVHACGNKNMPQDINIGIHG